MQIYIFSDTAGLAISELVTFTMAKFDTEYKEKTFSQVRSKLELENILGSLDIENSFIFYSFQDLTLSLYIKDFVSERKIPYVDYLAYSIDRVKNMMNLPINTKSIFIASYSSDQYRRLDALDFAVKFDDGADFRGLKYCDLALIGVSRSSKTPLSMYLASKGLKVSNIPLIIDSVVPRELFEIDPRRIIGLTIDKDLLKKLRDERLKSLKLSNDSRYSSIERISKELNFALDIFYDLDCKVIDVSYRSIEETSEIIINHLYKYKLIERKENE